MKTLIATPTANGTVTTVYTHTLVAACHLFAERGEEFEHAIFDSADLRLARNFFSNYVLLNPEFTHVLFVDSDMHVDRRILERLVDKKASMVGVIYPERSLDYPAFHQAAADGHQEPTARALASRFNVQFAQDRVEIANGFCEVSGIGFGCVLVERALLERIATQELASKIQPGKLAHHGFTDRILDFFGPIETEDGQILSEDYSFCRRVMRAGDKITALADAEVGHAGRIVYKSSYLRQLEALATSD